MTVAVDSISGSVTAEEALKLMGSRRWELVRGEVQEMPPAGGEHGFRSMWLAFYLLAYVKDHDLGAVLAAETGFLISRDPDTVRAPDVAFIAKCSVPDQWPRGWLTLVPDLVIEVVSPSDTVGQVEDKIADWLSFGVRRVLAVYPGTRTIQVHRPDQSPQILTVGETLDGEDVVPGFSLPVRDIFA